MDKKEIGSVGQIGPGHKFPWDKPSDPADITSYPTTADIWKSGKFTPAERKAEYRRRGKSPSGVIDGEYNDTFLEPGSSYSDMYRDWDADA